MFLDRATQDEAHDDLGAASENLFRYLKLRPDDISSQIRLAKDYSKAARSRQEKSRAAQLLARAIGSEQVDQPTA